MFVESWYNKRDLIWRGEAEMGCEELKQKWQEEEKAARIHGWDFSHISDKYEETELPWNYEAVIRSVLKEGNTLLDIDTGGGEFLMALGWPPEKTSATEGYPPNVALCREILLPKGYDFREAADPSALPFSDEQFDVVINRHGSFDARELYRILKPGGLFVTQQVGEENERDLVELLLPGTPKPFSGLNLSDQEKNFQKAGFEILRGKEFFGPIRFFDVGALVWFARILQWEFPDFSVERCFEQLVEAQEILERKGSIDGTIHRYLIVAQKKIPQDQ